MKRILSILLAVTMLIAAGCASSSAPGAQNDPGQTNNGQTEDNTPATPPEGNDETDVPSDTGDDVTDEGNTGNDPSGDAPAEDEYTPPENPDYNPTTTGYKLGDTLADFKVSTHDGEIIRFTEVLAEKDVILINIFATWCGPCKDEFPFMEKAYKQFQDRVEVIALSGDSSDTAIKVRQLASSLGLTFPMGLDSASLSSNFKINAYPTTIVIDRFGTIVYTHVGSFPDAESFICLFEYLLSEEYTESEVLDKLPPMMPHLDQLSNEDLSAALESNVVIENAPGLYNWPMTVAEVDGRTALVATNKGMDRSSSAVRTTVKASAGDVFAFDLKLSSETGFDFFRMSVNGKLVKVFSGDVDWTSYAYQFAADGEYVVELAYTKDDYTGVGEDTLWLDNARLLSGDDAAAALAANPAYPVAEETSFYITNENVMKVVFDDPYNIVSKMFGGAYEAYLINELEAKCVFTLGAGVDPDAAICYDNHDLTYTLSDLVSGDGYAVTFTIDSLDTTGKGYTYVTLDPDILSEGEKYPIVFFADIEGLEKFVKTFSAGAWHDADEWEGNQGGETEEEPQGDVTYKFVCEDENGERIAGVTLQVCNDSTCSVYVTDANGECVLTLPSDSYEIHVLKAPDGYAYDSATVYEVPASRELTITLNRA